MGRKFKVWLDSGANFHSKYEQVVDLEDDLGISDEEWEQMDDEGKNEVMKEIAWDRMDWGFEEI
ncbi:DUF7167 family protein [Cronobacter sakazakii]|uniref:DUF7167 family protein n=1 Tax=Cronobacter sakazakii TaxID=28141 RepID=UPI00029C4F7F|nr:hypothetical protein [Cronobacter sakazakii]CCK00819.1 FIG01049431: hypothetical protein [Cronobacter sakazakii 701]CCK05617.1 FIG01049431: hypothetical protein [Cronobacter sakazakii 696]ELY2630696.1 hypothetical protein [Cronobacter sakazakii]ELY2637466.1 hypothetical protein [Cronobacter sakazakii]ELY2658524.1 hypothetical protein [Cronobacter sakazakii]